MNTDQYEDILDSRNVQERIDELEDTTDEGEKEELMSLLAFKKEAEDVNSEWDDGATFIRYSYFEEYAQQLADDIGAIDRNATWPLNCIDWEQAARELQYDYSSVDFNGVEYWVQST